MNTYVLCGDLNQNACGPDSTGSNPFLDKLQRMQNSVKDVNAGTSAIYAY